MPIIHSELEKNGSPPPIFETDDERSYFLCTIKIHPLATHERYLKPTDVTKDKTKDKELVISSLKDVDRYLRSLDDQRWDLEKNKIVSEVKDLFLKVLQYCINPKTREEIFNHGAVYKYFDVPKEEYEALITASAIGSYFFHNIRNNYNNEELS